mmetsp:Transcript_3014/g.7029  ORF Transcript_3014/g.7029 Transcript_3014/m.7029 type:complete len:350 (+) Transcript_3014:607-1656(+)
MWRGVRWCALRLRFRRWRHPLTRGTAQHLVGFGRHNALRLCVGLIRSWDVVRYTGSVGQLSQLLKLSLWDHAAAVELVGNGTAPSLLGTAEPFQLRDDTRRFFIHTHARGSLTIAEANELASFKSEADEVAVVIGVLYLFRCFPSGTQGRRRQGHLRWQWHASLMARHLLGLCSGLLGRCLRSAQGGSQQHPNTSPCWRLSRLFTIADQPQQSIQQGTERHQCFRGVGCNTSNDRITSLDASLLGRRRQHLQPPLTRCEERAQRSSQVPQAPSNNRVHTNLYAGLLQLRDVLAVSESSVHHLPEAGCILPIACPRRPQLLQLQQRCLARGFIDVQRQGHGGQAHEDFES